MKKYILSRLAATAVLALCSSCVVVATPIYRMVLTRHHATQVGERFYTALVESDYQRAFQYVKSYRYHNDEQVDDAHQDMERHWISRVQQLKAQGSFIKELLYLSVTLDDGYPMGVAAVVIVMDNQTREVLHHIHFIPDKEGWKISRVGVRNATMEPGTLDYALSGHIAP